MAVDAVLESSLTPSSVATAPATSIKEEEEEAPSSSVSVPRQQQEAEASAKRKRSRRRRLLLEQQLPREPTEEEYLALCLVALASGGRDVRAPVPLMDLHACSVCGKAFASYQALGGHKASHRAKPPQEEQHAAPSSSPAGSAADGAKPPPAAAVHECHVCGKAFPTGQALGGHKRCHYDGTIGSAAAPATARAHSTSRATSTATATTGGGFDLNLPALPDVVPERCAAEEDEVLSPLAFKKPRFMIIPA